MAGYCIIFLRRVGDGGLLYYLFKTWWGWRATVAGIRRQYPGDSVDSRKSRRYKVLCLTTTPVNVSPYCLSMWCCVGGVWGTFDKCVIQESYDWFCFNLAMNHHSQKDLIYVWRLGLDLTKHRWFEFMHKDLLIDWLEQRLNFWSTLRTWRILSNLYVYQ